MDNLPNSLHQIFEDFTNTTFIPNPHREIPALNINLHEQQKLTEHISEQGMHLIADSGNKFRCMRCDKVYMSKGNLTRHLKFECGVKPQFQCIHCPIRTKHKSSLLSHMSSKHPGM